MPLRSPGRRALLAGGAAALAWPAARSQPRNPARPLQVVQFVDTSTREQDVAKDFLVGARAAWQDINARGGLRGRPVQHLAIELADEEAWRQAWPAVRDNPGCIALFGTVSDPLAVRLVAQLRQDGAGLAHVAPWLQNSSVEIDERTFPIFAGRQEQIVHALSSLQAMGVAEAGAVFASAREQELYGADVARTATALKLRISSWRADGDLARLGQRLGPATPPLLLFIGGTPELVQFTQGLDRQSRQRYVIALADINLQTVAQMGGGRSTPVIATQPVPMTSAALPIVRRYREVLGRLFDEPPAALSLAGFIAARYTFEVLDGIDAPLSRASVLAAFQRRADTDVGGFRVSYDEHRRGSSFVTQSMLTADGRIIG